MANTTTVSGRMIEVSSIDSDWHLSNDYAELSQGGLFLESIVFIPGALGDECIIKEGSASGAEVFHVSATSSDDQRTQYYHGLRSFPYLDFSAGSYSANAKVVINIK